MRVPVDAREARDPRDAADLRAASWMRRAALACGAVALFIALGGGLAWLAQRSRFDFRTIQVRGDVQHVADASLRAALAGRLRGNFFTLRMDEARRAFEQVPWVAHASVRRVWPDRLVVTLTEHHPVGVWSDGRLLSDTGVLFDANPAEAELGGPLVEFDGPSRMSAEAVSRLADFSSALARRQMAVAAIEVSDRGGWTVRTRDGLRIAFGRDEPAGALHARLVLAVEHYPDIVSRLRAAPARMDLRYPNGIAAAPAG